MRLWCTKCDVNMIKKGIALDCPEDGIFYQCPSCNYRIVVFKEEIGQFEGGRISLDELKKELNKKLTKEIKYICEDLSKVVG